jgi:hypothetical protein
MLINRSHALWAWFTLLATAASIVLYLMVFHPDTLPFRMAFPEWFAPKHRQHFSVGNTPLGLLYGAIAYAIFIFAVLLNVRKRFPLMRVGRAQAWLRAHIWLTILTLPLVFMHADFRFGGPMTATLMWLYLAVMFSGFYGLALQQFMPRLLKDRLSLETIYEQIPFLTQQLFASALKMREELQPAAVLAASGGGGGTAEENDPSASAMVDALEITVLPYLGTKSSRKSRMNNPTFATEFFRMLGLRVSPEMQGRVGQLASWCEERRQMELQKRYHHWLHGWLLVHVPTSFLLIILTGWHAVALLFLY